MLYAGAAPGFAGVYQVNAQLPSGLTPGNYAVWIEMSGRASNGGILQSYKNNLINNNSADGTPVTVVPGGINGLN